MHSPALPLAPEFDLVAFCTRLDRSEPASSLTSGVDWTLVLALAQRHGVTALVHDALREACPEGLPVAALRALETRTASERARHARLRATLGALLERLAAFRIDAAPLRCARLADFPGEVIELDLLVRPDDAAKTWSRLAAEGFEDEVPLDPDRVDAFRLIHAARRFVHPARGVVSVQWDVADSALAHGPSARDLWKRASPGTLDGHPCLTLAGADRLLLACVRGTLNRWQRLIWVREVAEIMRAVSPAELDEALARATRTGARRALALGASLAARLAGAPLPLGFADAARDPAVTDLTGEILADMSAAARPLAGPTDIARFHLRSRERRRDQVSYAIRRAALPGPADVDSPRLTILDRLLVPARRVLSVGRQSMRRRSPVHGRHIARFVPTPPHVVDRMLALAGVTPADRLLDLGCGDGAIVIRAAQRVGCRGVGVDLEASLVELARARARAAGVEALVEFHQGDAREADLSTPTVVCLYLSASLVIRPQLQRGLRPGARVVSFNFDMGDWPADEVDVIDETPWGSNTLYLWRIEADAASRAAA